MRLQFHPVCCHTGTATEERGEGGKDVTKNKSHYTLVPKSYYGPAPKTEPSWFSTRIHPSETTSAKCFSKRTPPTPSFHMPSPEPRALMQPLGPPQGVT